jgi:Peptidase S24-like
MQKNSHIKTRILEYIDFKGITKYEFYKRSKITRSVLDKDSGISEDNITKFLAYDPNVSLHWLIKGEGDMLLTPDFMANEPSARYNDAVVKPVPLYNLNAAEGLAALFKETATLKAAKRISIPNVPECDGAIVVTGDGMYPFLKSGDMVMYKEIHNIAEGIFWGELYLISIDLDGEEYVSVKWIQKSEKGQNYVKLVSENKKHEPKDIPINRILALALVKASIHIHAMQ